MTKHRLYSAAFKRQVAEEFIAGETLHALAQRHDISQQLIRTWVGKFKAGALDGDGRLWRQRRWHQPHAASRPRGASHGRTFGRRVHQVGDVAALVLRSIARDRTYHGRICCEDGMLAHQKTAGVRFARHAPRND